MPRLENSSPQGGPPTDKGVSPFFKNLLSSLKFFGKRQPFTKITEVAQSLTPKHVAPLDPQTLKIVKGRAPAKSEEVLVRVTQEELEIADKAKAELDKITSFNSDTESQVKALIQLAETLLKQNQNGVDESSTDETLDNESLVAEMIMQFTENFSEKLSSDSQPLDKLEQQLAEIYNKVTHESDDVLEDMIAGLKACIEESPRIDPKNEPEAVAPTIKEKAEAALKALTLEGDITDQLQTVLDTVKQSITDLDNQFGFDISNEPLELAGHMLLLFIDKNIESDTVSVELKKEMTAVKTKLEAALSGDSDAAELNSSLQKIVDSLKLEPEEEALFASLDDLQSEVESEQEKLIREIARENTDHTTTAVDKLVKVKQEQKSEGKPITLNAVMMAALKHKEHVSSDDAGEVPTLQKTIQAEEVAIRMLSEYIKGKNQKSGFAAASRTMREVGKGNAQVTAKKLEKAWTLAAAGTQEMPGVQELLQKVEVEVLTHDQLKAKFTEILETEGPKSDPATAFLAAVQERKPGTHLARMCQLMHSTASGLLTKVQVELPTSIHATAKATVDGFMNVFNEAAPENRLYKDAVLIFTQGGMTEEAAGVAATRILTSIQTMAEVDLNIAEGQLRTLKTDLQAIAKEVSTSNYEDYGTLMEGSYKSAMAAMNPSGIYDGLIKSFYEQVARALPKESKLRKAVLAKAEDMQVKGPKTVRGSQLLAGQLAKDVHSETFKAHQRDELFATTVDMTPFADVNVTSSYKRLTTKNGALIKTTVAVDGKAPHHSLRSASFGAFRVTAKEFQKLTFTEQQTYMQEVNEGINRLLDGNKGPFTPVQLSKHLGLSSQEFIRFVDVLKNKDVPLSKADMKTLFKSGNGNAPGNPLMTLVSMIRAHQVLDGMTQDPDLHTTDQGQKTVKLFRVGMIRQFGARKKELPQLKMERYMKECFHGTTVNGAKVEYTYINVPQNKGSDWEMTKRGDFMHSNPVKSVYAKGVADLKALVEEKGRQNDEEIKLAMQILESGLKKTDGVLSSLNIRMYEFVAQKLDGVVMHHCQSGMDRTTLAQAELRAILKQGLNINEVIALYQGKSKDVDKKRLKEIRENHALLVLKDLKELDEKAQEFSRGVPTSKPNVYSDALALALKEYKWFKREFATQASDAVDA